MGKTRKGLRYTPKDAYYQKAKGEGYVARSIFKLEEIDKRWKIFKPGLKVLDVGCAPGSWLQYASRKIGERGRILGFDIEPVRIEGLRNAEIWVADIHDIRPDEARFQGVAPFDLIQSDAMVKTCGIAESDCARSIALVESSVALVQKGLLKTGGNFIAKVFEGPGFTEFYVAFKKLFKRTYVSRPEAVREGSREVYVVGLDFKGQR